MQTKASTTSQIGSQASKQRASIVAKWLAAYSHNYPGYDKVTPLKCELFEQAMADIEPMVLDRAMAKALQRCPKFPVIAEIRKLAEECRGATSEVEAEKALAWLDRLVEKWGVDRTPEYVGQSERYPDGFWRCPEIGGAIGHALAAVGGWRAYASRTERDAPFMRRDFLESYTRYRSAGQKPCELIGAPAGEFAIGVRQIAEGVAL